MRLEEHLPSRLLRDARDGGGTRPAPARVEGAGAGADLLRAFDVGDGFFLRGQRRVDGEALDILHGGALPLPALRRGTAHGQLHLEDAALKHAHAAPDDGGDRRHVVGNALADTFGIVALFLQLQGNAAKEGMPAAGDLVFSPSP